MRLRQSIHESKSHCTFSFDVLVTLHQAQLLHMPDAHFLPFVKCRPGRAKRSSYHELYRAMMGSTYRTTALFFTYTTSSSRSFAAITRFVMLQYVL